MPKATAFNRTRFTARLYNYTEQSDPTGAPIRTYAFKRVLNLDIQQTVFGKLNVTLPEGSEDVMQRAQLHELKDADGNEIFPGGIWELQGVAPILTAFGKREGYRSVAQLALQTLPS